MEILQECKRFLSYGGLGSEPYVNIAGKRIPRMIFRASIYLLLLLLTSVHSTNTINSYSLGLQAMLPPVHYLLHCIAKCTVYFVLSWKTNEIARLINCIGAVVQRRCNVSSASYTIYAARNSYEKKIVRGIVEIICGLFAVGYIPSSLCWLSTLIFGVPSTEYLKLPDAIDDALPIDTRQPLSFGIALLTEFVLVQGFMTVSILFLMIYISISTYVRPIINDLSAIIEQRSDSIEHRISYKEKFVEFVKLHEDLYKILDRFENIISVPMFVQLPIFGLLLAVALYLIEGNITHSSLAVAFGIAELIFYAGENYLMCYFVSSIIDDTESIGDIAYNLSWYQMPRSERICVEMIIRRSQRPFELKGLGVFVCSLETYLKLIRSAISYYMIFRRLNAA